MKTEQIAKPTQHINYLDGIRGLSAFYVVMYHIYHQLTTYQSQHVGPSRLMFILQILFGWGGHDCVTVFICLSGFSLTIPLAKAGYRSLSQPGNLKNYFIRRSLRIAPPYLLAIAAIVTLATVYPALSQVTPQPWSNALPILNLQSVLTHVFFIHALDPSQVYKISPQFWSIGTEAQLYLWLPFALVPMALRKSMEWGVVASLVACIGFLLVKSFDLACLHYIFTFSLGAFAADRIYNPQSKGRPINLFAILVIVGLFAGAIFVGKSMGSFWAARDLILSPLMALGLFLLVKGELSPKLVSVIRSTLGSRVMTFLGKISYSLYLVHYVVIGFLHAVLVGKGVSIHLTVIILILVSPLLSIFIAKLLQMTVEAPSMKLAKQFRDGVSKTVLADGPKTALK